MNAATQAASPPQDTAPAAAAYPWGLYFHVIVVSLICGFGVLAGENAQKGA